MLTSETEVSRVPMTANAVMGDRIIFEKLTGGKFYAKKNTHRFLNNHIPILSKRLREYDHGSDSRGE